MSSATGRTIAITAMVAAVVGAAPAGAQVAGAGSTPEVKLSDEFKLSRWAYPATRAKVRTEPRPGAKAVARLHYNTEDGYPEVYLLLAQQTDAHGNTWVRLRVPGRPNGRSGWVPREALGPYNVVRTSILVNRRTLRATVYKRGKRVFSTRIGVGAPSTPTPAGRYWVREKFKVKNAPFYGPYAIGLSAYAPRLTDWPNGGVVGLHGTSLPNLIPGRPSHGCIRLRNDAITRVYRLVGRGTPVRIV